MWCGTIFVHDEDGNGDIDMDSTDEYQTMSEANLYHTHAIPLYWPAQRY